MKTTIFTILSFCYINSFAQTKPNPIYYLLDTIKTPVNERMWSVSSNNSYKKYIINCPCLEYGGKPTFLREIKERGVAINKLQFNKIKFTTLANLVQNTKYLLANYSGVGRISVFIIEPKGKQFIMYETMLYNPNIKIVSGPDVFKAKPDNSAFEKKDLILVKSGKINSYLDKSVLISGKIVETKVEADAVLLYLHNNSLLSDVTILIKTENRKNFDLPERHYKHNDVRVAGKVIRYNDQPVLEITNENQIQVVEQQ